MPDGESTVTTALIIGRMSSNSSRSAHSPWMRGFRRRLQKRTWRISPTLRSGTPNVTSLSSGSYMLASIEPLSVDSLSVFAKSTVRTLPSTPMISTHWIVRSP